MITGLLYFGAGMAHKGSVQGIPGGIIGVGMLLGLIIFLWGQNYVEGLAEPPSEKYKEKNERTNEQNKELKKMKKERKKERKKGRT